MNAIVNGHTIIRDTEPPLVEFDVELGEEQKIEKIEFLFGKIMKTLGLDLDDDSLRGTPRRVARMYVKEMFSGLNPDNNPTITLFKNTYGYRGMLVEKDITIYSSCEHHFVPIIGKVHVAYIPHQQVIGLSKINRVVQYYAKRPQVQERLTIEIAGRLIEVLQHDDVAVYIEADHLCVASRGIKDTCSSTVTATYMGRFQNEKLQQEFLSCIHSKK